MENTSPTANAWYNKTWLVILLLFIFFPVGLYALWKSDTILKNVKMGVTGVFVLLIIIGIFADDNKPASGSSDSGTALSQHEKDSLAIIKSQTEAENREVNETKSRKELIDKQFSGWDGSHRGLTKYIKENMNDPDSYEHIETRFMDRGDHIFVATKFRGANAFGGKVVSVISAKVDVEGTVIEIVPN